jgi:hypothetical protein
MMTARPWPTYRTTAPKQARVVLVLFNSQLGAEGYDLWVDVRHVLHR